MIHNTIDVIIDEMALIDIDYFSKLSLFIEAHRPVTEDAFFGSFTSDIVAERVFDLVSISPDIR